MKESIVIPEHLVPQFEKAKEELQKKSRKTLFKFPIKFS